MIAATVDIGPNAVAVIIALIAFATTVFNGIQGAKTRKDVKTQGTELQPNGGSSLRDAIDRIEAHAKVAADSAKLPPPPPPA